MRRGKDFPFPFSIFSFNNNITIINKRFIGTSFQGNEKNKMTKFFPSSKRWNKSNFNIGDFVKVQTFNNEFKIGIIVSLPLCNDIHNRNQDANKIMLYTREDSIRPWNSNFFRFHYPSSSSLILEDLMKKIEREGKSNQINMFHSTLNNIENTCKKLLSRSLEYIEKSMRDFENSLISSNQLFYESEIVEMLFKNEIVNKDNEIQKDQSTLDNIIFQYSTHLYLFFNTRLILKDKLYQLDGPYLFRPKSEINLLNQISSLSMSNDQSLQENKDYSSKLNAFKKKLFKAIYEGEEISKWDDKDKFFISILRTFAENGFINSAMNPFYDHVNIISKGVFNFSSYSDALNILEIIKEMNYNPPGTIPHVQLTFPNLPSSPSSPIPLPSQNYFVDNNKNNKSRIDIQETVYAIDSKESNEIDDAVSVKTERDGSQWLQIHIADPTELFQIDDIHDRNARVLASSAYLPTAQYSMLPKSLTLVSSLTSNRPLNNALTFSAKINSLTGDLIDYKLELSNLCKVKRIFKEEIDLFLEGTTEPQLNLIKHLTSLHQRYRQQNGSISCELDRPKMQVIRNERNEILNIKFGIERGNSIDRLVSESMIIAGRIAAKLLSDYKMPAPFRYQNCPDNVPVELLSRLTNHNSTLTFPNHSSNIADKFSFITKHVQPSGIDLESKPHWMLGLDSYIKSTSPIRRYLDTIVHRQLKNLLSPDLYRGFDKESLEKIIPSLYKSEKYLKRMERVHNRYWALYYLSHFIMTSGKKSLLSTSSINEPLLMDAILLEYDPITRNSIFWLESLALPVWCNYPVYEINTKHVGESCKVRILKVDLHKQFIDLQLAH